MRYLSFDIECIEGQFSLGNLCEFGYVLADENFDIIKQENILIKPVSVPTELKCKLQFSYSLKEYNNAPPFTESYQKIIGLLESGDVTIVGHAIHNDVYCVNRACAVHGLRLPNYSFIDSQIIYAVFKGNNEIMSLDKIAVELGYDFVHHKADEDARIALMSLKSVLDKTSLTLDNVLMKYNVQCGTTTDGHLIPCNAMHVNSGACNVNSKNSRRKLLKLFIEQCDNNADRNKCGRYSGKKFHLVANDVIGDMDKARGIVKFLYDEGARSVNFIRQADIVIGEVDDKYLTGKTVNYMTDQFADNHSLPLVKVDEAAMLQQYNEDKIKTINSVRNKRRGRKFVDKR